MMNRHISAYNFTLAEAADRRKVAFFRDQYQIISAAHTVNLSVSLRG